MAPNGTDGEAQDVTANRLYYGDNLEVLRTHIPDEAVDLVYLDPPFNSKQDYNVLFETKVGAPATAQIEAFDDTWHWGEESERAFLAVADSGYTKCTDILILLRQFLGDNDMMAYLSMMSIRLIELHRVLRSTGSLYLHCDPTASHYLKLILDSIFGPRNFRNEICWKRTSSHNDVAQGLGRYGKTHDIIFYYGKSKKCTWNPQFAKYDERYLSQHYSNIEPDTGRRYKTSDLTAAKPGGNTSYEWKGIKPPRGRYWAYSIDNMAQFESTGRLVYAAKSRMPRLKHYLDKMPGVTIGSVWDDIPPINSQAQERLGYPTQKPIALLERIICSSSNTGDIVLDPFCGCGTAVHASEATGRRWIGIDITYLAVGLVERRIRAAFPNSRFLVAGAPKDLEGAAELAERDPYQFQWWSLSMIDAQPQNGKRKGSDGGIDGIIYFRSSKDRLERALVSVKGGRNLGVGAVKDLWATMERERAPVGVLISLADPTRPMEREAASAGLFRAELTQPVPRIQLLTVRDLLSGRKPRIPLVDVQAAFRAPTRHNRAPSQSEMVLA